MKRCPKCAEIIKNNASICRYCGAEQPKKFRNWPVFLVVLAGFFMASVIGSRLPERNKETIAKRSEIPGEECKGYKGEARNLSGIVKQRLRNPSSFEHVQTNYGPLENGTMLATMRYRAINGFGAVDTYTAIGEVRVPGCAARIVNSGS